MLRQEWHPAVRHLHVADNLVDRLGGIEIITCPGGLRVHLGCFEVLELNSVRASIGGYINQSQRLLEVTVVVASGFRDDIAPLAFTYPAIPNLDSPGSHREQSSTIAWATRLAPTPSTTLRPARLMASRRSLLPDSSDIAVTTFVERSASRASPIQI